MYVFKIKWNSNYLKFLSETLYIFKKILTCPSFHYHLLSVSGGSSEFSRINPTAYSSTSFTFVYM